MFASKIADHDGYNSSYGSQKYFNYDIVPALLQPFNFHDDRGQLENRVSAKEMGSKSEERKITGLN